MATRKPKKFPGMKEQPVLGRRKIPDVTYKDLVEFDGLPRPSMNRQQLNTFNKFIQVREGETREQWLNRTANRRVTTEEDLKLLRKSHPIIVRETRRKKKEKEYNDKKLKIFQTARDFDYLKYYGVVLNYHSIKYGLYKEWLEVGFFFYDGIPFSRERFENACVLNFCTSRGTFLHFKKKGWLVPLTKKEKNKLGRIIEKPTGLYMFHQGFTVKITYIYKILAKLSPIMLCSPMSKVLDAETKKIIHQMNDEIMEIKTGKKPQEDIMS